MASGSEILANTLFPVLLGTEDFTFPVVDLSLPIFSQPTPSGEIGIPLNPLTIEDLTTGQVGGTGVFDLLMMSLKAHLKEEYEASRISGAEYTKAYIGLVQTALASGVQFLLGKDQAYWQALLIKEQAKVATIEAVKARVELETAKFQLVRARFEAATGKVNFALIKLKLATEDATYGNLLAQGEGIAYTNANILPVQRTLLQEQIEVQRAQTSDTRADGAIISGNLGKQKELYSQQITSYQRDSELKATKLFTDAWITNKTIDEGVLAPNNFTNAQLDIILTKLRDNVGLLT